MKDEIKEILQLIGNCCYYGKISEDKCEKYCNCITNLEKVADERMSTILDIEKYCIDEKEDLISGGEVCEDVLKIIDELKGK